MSRTRSYLSRDALVLAAYLVLALVLTYPLVLHLNTHVSGQGVDDPAQTWSLWWTKFALFNLGTSPLSTDYLFYPAGINLVAYTPTFLNGLLSLPLQFALGVIPAQNLIAYFVLVTSGYGMYLLARELLKTVNLAADRKTVAAAFAGAFFAFGAWHIHYADATYMLLSNEWLPFYALYLLRLKTHPVRNGLLLALFLLLTTWTELTFALFLAIFTALYLVFLLVAERGALFNTIKGLAVPAAPVLIGASPLWYALWSDTARFGYYLAAGLGRVQIFSAEPISFFVPSPQHPILGALASTLTTANTRYAFIGYAVLILAGLGLYFGRRARPALFWFVSAVFFALLMLGPTLMVDGQNTGIPLPFAALRELPFLNANRYPVRFNVMLMLAVAPLAALGAANLLRMRRGALALGGLGLLMLFEQLVIPIPLSDLTVPPVYSEIAKERGDFAILELPLGWRGSVAMQGKMEDQAEFYQTVHGKRLLGGITSRTPRFKFQYFLELPVVNSLIALESGREVDEARLERDRAEAPEVLRFFNIRYVDVNRSLADDALHKYALDVFPLQEVYRDEERILYRVTPDIAAPVSNRIDRNDETDALYFDDRWGRPQPAEDGTSYRWATQDGAELWLPLAPGDHIVTLRLRGWQEGQKLSVRIGGETIGEVTLSSEWKTNAVQIPGRMVHSALTRLVFSTVLGQPTAEVRAIGDTGVVSPVDIVATGAGFDAGRFGEIYVAGKSIVSSQRGYQLVAINPTTGTVDSTGLFDTFGDPGESTRMLRFVQSLPRGEIVAGVGTDEVSRNLQADAITALRELGVESDLRSQFRVGHAFIGVKGAAPGTALEDTQGRVPANVAAGKNVTSDRVAFALGEVTLDR